MCLSCNEISLIEVYNIRPHCEKCMRSSRPELAGTQEGKLVTIPEGHYSESQKEFKTKEFIFVSATNKNREYYKNKIVGEVDGLLKIRTIHLAPTSKDKIEIICPITKDVGRFVPTRSCYCSTCESVKMLGYKSEIKLESKKKIEKKWGVKLIEFIGLDYECHYTRKGCDKVYKSSGRNLLHRGPKTCKHYGGHYGCRMVGVNFFRCEKT